MRVFRNKELAAYLYVHMYVEQNVSQQDELCAVLDSLHVRSPLYRARCCSFTTSTPF